MRKRRDFAYEARSPRLKLPTELSPEASVVLASRSPVVNLEGNVPPPDSAAALRRSLARLFSVGADLHKYTTTDDQECPNKPENEEERSRMILTRGANGVLLQWLDEAIAPITDVPLFLLGGDAGLSLEMARIICFAVRFSAGGISLRKMPSDADEKCTMCGAVFRNQDGARVLGLNFSMEHIVHHRILLRMRTLARPGFSPREDGADLALCAEHADIVRGVIDLFYWVEYVLRTRDGATPYALCKRMYVFTKKLRYDTELFVDEVADILYEGWHTK